MYKHLVVLLSISSALAMGCGVEPGTDDGELSSDERALSTNVVFSGGGNTGFSNSTGRTATITADSAAHASASGGIGIDLRVDDSRRPAAGSVTTAQCLQRTVTVTYNQADTGTFDVTTPKAVSRNGRCIATVVLNWSKRNPPGTKRFASPSTASGSQSVSLSTMPVRPAIGTITVATKTNGVTNADPFNFRVDPAQ